MWTRSSCLFSAKTEWQGLPAHREEPLVHDRPWAWGAPHDRERMPARTRAVRTLTRAPGASRPAFVGTRPGNFKSGPQADGQPGIDVAIPSWNLDRQATGNDLKAQDFALPAACCGPAMCPVGKVYSESKKAALVPQEIRSTMRSTSHSTCHHQSVDLRRLPEKSSPRPARARPERAFSLCALASPGRSLRADTRLMRGSCSLDKLAPARRRCAGQGRR